MSVRSPSPSTPASTPPSADESGSESSDGVPDEPPYSPQELADIFLEFYSFLKTIHFKDVNLKMPPPDGWPNIAQSSTSSKTERVYQVIRLLPFFEDAPEALIHYNSRLLDYTRMPVEDVDEAFEGMDERLEDYHYSERRIMDIDASATFPFTQGTETGARDLYLNVWDGEVTEDCRLLDTVGPVDVRHFFDELREHYESLKLIPCYNRFMLEAQNVPEYSGVITEEQITAQSEEWGTDLDIQYIRQLYRGFGWPHDYRKDEAIQAVHDLMERIKDRRGEWQFMLSGFDNGLY
ncbi:hypothetical protein ACJZ2D_009359 [Fusarium nematophilum]